MKKRVVLILIASLIAFAGCAKNNEEKALKNVIIENTDAMNKEDAARYMSTIYNDGTGLYESTDSIIATLFEGYDLDSKVISTEIIEIKDNTALVRATTKTIKKSGGLFADNEAVMVHTMYKDNGVWKIQSTRIEDMKYLNQ